MRKPRIDANGRELKRGKALAATFSDLEKSAAGPLDDLRGMR